MKFARAAKVVVQSNKEIITMGSFQNDLGGDVAFWGKEAEISSARLPIVLQFHPTKFVSVSKAKAKKWQAVLKNQLGISPVFDEDGPYGPQGTISGSGDGWDDCDA